jgi:hypothetical protein
MSVTLQANPRPTAKPAPVVRRRLTLEELVRRAAIRVEQGPKQIVGTFRHVVRGRAITGVEKIFLGIMAGGLSLAIWLQARPEPVNAHALHYQSVAWSAPIQTTAPLAFAESALQALGTDWRAATFFSCTAPGFWREGPEVHPNARLERVERGLARLAGHGPLVGLMTFPAQSAVETESVDGAEMLATRAAGQIELSDGTVVRFAMRLIQDPVTKRWGMVELSIPGFLP